MHSKLAVLHQGISLLLVGLGYYLATRHRQTLFYFVILGSLAIVLQFALLDNPSKLEWMQFIKLLCLIPLGLGAILGFGVLSHRRQQAHLACFTVFINIAVVGNIFMMVFVPADGTYRGISSRMTCILLVVWLLQEMAKAKWQTVKYDKGLFLFNSSLLSWIICHAFYRIALISLPSFHSAHYLLMEPLSLTIMYLLYSFHSRKYPIYYYFGYSDTLVVASLALASFILDTSGNSFHQLSENLIPKHKLDLIFVPLHVIVSCIAMCAVWLNFKYQQDARKLS